VKEILAGQLAEEFMAEVGPVSEKSGDKVPDLSFLIEAAAWQDSLLQSYRSLHLTFQSILLAIGIGLISFLLSIDKGFPPLSPETFVIVVLIYAVWGLEIYSSRKMQKIIYYRGEDVNYWHRTIILAEQALKPGLRFFTKFKIDQQARRKNVEHLNELFLSSATTKKINEQETNLLIEKGLGHTRRVVDKNLFLLISLIWVLLGVVNTVVVVRWVIPGLF
jgi:hypothetical protein